MFLEASAGTFNAILNEKQYPMYNDFEEGFDTKLRLEKDLNEVVIGHWKSEDGEQDYYSKVSKCYMSTFKTYVFLSISHLI